MVLSRFNMHEHCDKKSYSEIVCNSILTAQLINFRFFEGEGLHFPENSRRQYSWDNHRQATPTPGQLSSGQFPTNYPLDLDFTLTCLGGRNSERGNSPGGNCQGGAVFLRGIVREMARPGKFSGYESCVCTPFGSSTGG